MIPDVLPDEADYTKALSLSRLAADLESVASPVLAAVLLAFLSYSDLFAGTALGFAISAALVVSAVLPRLQTLNQRPFVERLTAGLHLFVHTPRLRGLVALSLASAAGGAMVFVNTVTFVQTDLALSEQHTAWALAAFGVGSIAAALTLPPLLQRFADRSVVLAGALLMAIVLGAGAVTTPSCGSLLLFVAGAWYRLLADTDAGRPCSEAFIARRRPNRLVRSALRAVARLLAPGLSGGRIYQRSSRNACGVHRARGPLPPGPCWSSDGMAGA